MGRGILFPGIRTHFFLVTGQSEDIKEHDSTSCGYDDVDDETRLVSASPSSHWYRHNTITVVPYAGKFCNRARRAARPKSRMQMDPMPADLLHTMNSIGTPSYQRGSDWKKTTTSLRHASSPPHALPLRSSIQYSICKGGTSG